MIDPRILTPLDRKTINNSVSKTRRLAVIDPGWRSFGAASEIITSISETQSKNMKTNPVRNYFTRQSYSNERPFRKNIT